MRRGEDNIMQFTCTCGNKMNLSLRTVIYSNRIEIVNVPMFTCESCQRSEVYSAVKGDLTSLIARLPEVEKSEGINDQPMDQIRFEESSELASLIMKATESDRGHESLTEIIEERINELLDVMLLAKSLNHADWVKETQTRLRQITDHYVIPGTAGNTC